METGKRMILHTAALVVASVAAGVEIDTAVVVEGAELGQVAMVSAPSLEGGLVASAFVSASNEVTVRISNVSAGAVDPADQDVFIAVTQD
jgi:hypothetical protein